jgi:integrase/recombinase XerD
MKRMKEYEKFIGEHVEVGEWLKDRPENTRRIFARELKSFCEALNVTPEAWRELDRFKARDLAWQYINTKTADNSSVANTIMVALKSFYRNKNGEALPFDSAKGGKHYFHVKLKKAAIEHIPNKQEMYQIIDMASSLRDKAILLFLFQSGVRVNVIQHLKLKHVVDQLDKDMIALKITPDLDFKLRSRDIPFYYTFLNGEGVETLRRYVALAHEQHRLDSPLFSTSSHEPISQSYVLRIVKNSCRKSGLDQTTIWTHSIRKAFRKIVRQADIDDDSKEQLMGHVLRGSRQSYYDSKDVETIQKEYQRCSFAREVPKSEVSKLKEQLETEQARRALTEARLEKLEADLENTRRLLTAFLEKKVEG